MFYYSVSVDPSTKEKEISITKPNDIDGYVLLNPSHRSYSSVYNVVEEKLNK